MDPRNTSTGTQTKEALQRGTGPRRNPFRALCPPPQPAPLPEKKEALFFSQKDESLSIEDLNNLRQIWESHEQIFCLSDKLHILICGSKIPGVAKEDTLQPFLTDVGRSIAEHFGSAKITSNDLPQVLTLLQCWQRAKDLVPSSLPTFWKNVSTFVAATKNRNLGQLPAAIDALMGIKDPAYYKNVIKAYKGSGLLGKNAYRLKMLETADGEILSGDRHTPLFTERGWGNIINWLNHERARDRINRYEFEETANALIRSLKKDIMQLPPGIVCHAAQAFVQHNIFDKILAEKYINYAHLREREFSPRQALRLFAALTEHRIHYSPLTLKAMETYTGFFSQTEEQKLFEKALLAFAIQADDKTMHKIWNAFLEGRSQLRLRRRNLIELYHVCLARDLLPRTPSDLVKDMNDAVKRRGANGQRPTLNTFEYSVKNALKTLGHTPKMQEYRFGYWVDCIIAIGEREVRIACDGAWFHRVGGDPKGMMLGRDTIKDRVFRQNGIPTVHILLEKWSRLPTTGMKIEWLGEKIKTCLAQHDPRENS